MPSMLSRRDVIRGVPRICQGLGLSLALTSPLLSLIACDGGGQADSAFNGATMGTTYSVNIPYLPAGIKAEILQAEIAAILDTVNQQMSTFRPDSELSQFNAAPAGVWTKVSPDTLTVVGEALKVAELSGGAFDPTIGPLVDLWGFGALSSGQDIPDFAQIKEILSAIGHRNVRARVSSSGLGKIRDGLRIDLAGIAKGFGVDKVAEYLERLGVEYYLVEIGGEIRGRGYSRRGEVWQIGIERPDSLTETFGDRALQRVVRLGGQALATSGDYRSFFTEQGERFSHLLDRRTGRPVNHGLTSVTVIALSAMRADALSTALMVLGPKAAMAMARRHRIAAYFIIKTGDRLAEAVSPDFRQYLVA